MGPQITGLGLITPLGGNCKETFAALINGEFITGDSAAKFKNGQGGTVNELALEAARQAISQAGWETWTDNTAIIAGTSKGDIESWLRAIGDIQCDRPADYPWLENFGLGDLAAALAFELGAQNCVRLTYSGACASSLHALARGVMMIQAGEIERALIVAAESSLHEMFKGCFDRLGVHAPAGEPARPFDIGRRGFHIGQAAAAVCIEKLSPAAPSCIARIDHVALGGDAWHITGVDPEGRTMRRLLQGAVGIGKPDLIHAHATATRSHDAVELAAIESVLQYITPLPALYSHKAALGHSLGASGLVSLVLNCLMQQEGRVPGNICTVNPLCTARVAMNREPVHRLIERSLVVAGGFGGANAVVSLRHSPVFECAT